MRATKPRSIRMEDTTWNAAKELAWRSRLSVAEWFKRAVNREAESAGVSLDYLVKGEGG